MKKILFGLLAICSILVGTAVKATSSPIKMAIFKSLLFGEIRNKLAGVVFSRNKSGAYLRQRVSGVNPKTVAQATVRTLMTTIAQSWRGRTEAQRLAWNVVAPSWVRMNVFNDNSPLSGFGLYCRLNRNLQTINIAPIADPPIHGDVVGLTSITLVADTGGGTFTATFAPAIPATQQMIFYATPGLSPGVSFVKSEYRLISHDDQVSVSPLDLAADYIAVFGALPGVGERVFVKAKPVVVATGQDGVAMEASDIAI